MKSTLWNIGFFIGGVAWALLWVTIGGIKAHELPPDAPLHRHYPELTHADILGPDGIPWTGDEGIFGHEYSPGKGMGTEGSDMGPVRPVPLTIGNIQFTTSDIMNLRWLLDGVAVARAKARAEAEAAKEGFVSK